MLIQSAARALPNDLHERLREAKKLLRSCVLCPRRCGVNRLDGERGYCGLDSRAWWFQELIHYGLEFELIPAHAIYLAGCNMRCVFCNAARWNALPDSACRWDTASMKQLVEERRAQGAKNLFFVGGEPTVSLHAILELLAALPERFTVVFDSNMYFSPETMELLRGVVDTYVADFKFGNDRCAQAIADAPDYFETVAGRLRFAESSASLIVRHLLMPGHFDCCFKPVLKWLKRELRAPRLAIRGEYMPPNRSARERATAGMNQYLPPDVYNAARDLAKETEVELVE